MYLDARAADNRAWRRYWCTRVSVYLGTWSLVLCNVHSRRKFSRNNAVETRISRTFRQQQLENARPHPGPLPPERENHRPSIDMLTIRLAHTSRRECGIRGLN